MDPSLSTRSGLIKCFLILILPLLIACSAAFFYGRSEQTSTMLSSEPSVLLRVPIQDKVWADIGAVPEPVITLSVKTASGYEKNEFILDSGAVISSLPREWASKVNVDLAYAKRVTFKGFGNTTSFAYQSTVNVLLANQLMSLPVVFTESEGTRSLIGRKGFFDTYTIAFNHRDKIIEIQQ